MPADPDDDLPFVDRHEVVVRAPARAVWEALPAALPQPGPGAGLLAPILGLDPARSSGAPFDEGACVPGFRVAAAVPERRVRLTGRHRFSRYDLAFTLEPAPGGTRLGATTHAEFPGVPGRLYRAAVIGSGGHALVVPRMLRSVRRRAERC